MNTLVVTESMWGNTRSVAEAIASGLPGEVSVIDVGEAPSTIPADVELLVIGGPTHAFSMTRITTRQDAVKQGAEPGHEATGIREWLGGLTASDDLEVATFDTRVTKVRKVPGSAAKAASRVVRRRHLGKVIDTESFFVIDSPGPLDEGELDRAEEWGRALGARVHA